MENAWMQSARERATSVMRWLGLSRDPALIADSDLDPALRDSLEAWLGHKDLRLLRGIGLLVLLNLVFCVWVLSRTHSRVEQRVDQGLDAVVAAALEGRTQELAGLVAAGNDELEQRIELARDVVARLAVNQLIALEEQGFEVRDAIGRSDAALRRLESSLTATLDRLTGEQARLDQAARDVDDLLYRLLELNGEEGFELARHLQALARAMQSGSAMDQLAYLRTDVEGMSRELREQEAALAEEREALNRLDRLLRGGDADDVGIAGMVNELDRRLHELSSKSRPAAGRDSTAGGN